MRASAVVEWRSGTVPLVAVRVRSSPTRYRSLGSAESIAQLPRYVPLLLVHICPVIRSKGILM